MAKKKRATKKKVATKRMTPKKELERLKALVGEGIAYMRKEGLLDSMCCEGLHVIEQIEKLVPPIQNEYRATLIVELSGVMALCSADVYDDTNYNVTVDYEGQTLLIDSVDVSGTEVV